MPFVRQFDENEVLERAAVAFWRKGYEGTSVADLVAATGLQRGSLYAGFGDKRGLFQAALAHYDRTYRHDYLSDLSEGCAPREAILNAFRAAATSECDLPPGCLIVNTALELAPHDAQAQRAVQDSFGALGDFFMDRVEAAKTGGGIAADTDTKDAAETLLGLFLGLRVLTRSGAAPEVRETIIRQAEGILRRPCAGTTRSANQQGERQ